MCELWWWFWLPAAIHRDVCTHISVSQTSTHGLYGLRDHSGKDGCSKVRQDTGTGQAGPISSGRVQIPSARQTDCVPEKPNSLGQRTSPGRWDFVWLPKNFHPIHYCAHTIVVRVMKLSLYTQRAYWGELKASITNCVCKVGSESHAVRVKRWCWREIKREFLSVSFHAVRQIMAAATGGELIYTGFVFV